MTPEEAAEKGLEIGEIGYLPKIKIEPFISSCEVVSIPTTPRWKRNKEYKNRQRHHYKK